MLLLETIILKPVWETDERERLYTVTSPGESTVQHHYHQVPAAGQEEMPINVIKGTAPPLTVTIIRHIYNSSFSFRIFSDFTWILPISKCENKRPFNNSRPLLVLTTRTNIVYKQTLSEFNFFSPSGINRTDTRYAWVCRVIFDLLPLELL